MNCPTSVITAWGSGFGHRTASLKASSSRLWVIEDLSARTEAHAARRVPRGQKEASRQIKDRDLLIFVSIGCGLLTEWPIAANAGVALSATKAAVRFL